MTQVQGATGFEREIRFILLWALGLFVYTVVVGILNGLDLVEFPRRLLLAHLHVGTLGWITLAVFASALALFGQAGRGEWIRPVAMASPVVALAYNIAFMTTAGYVRPVLGTLMLVVIVAFAVWGFGQARGRSLSVPQIGVLAGLVTSVVGAVLGILLGIYVANPASGITARMAEAHPATMVIGFLVPVGMALAEWVMRPGSASERASIWGWVQIGLPMLGAVALVFGLLLAVLPLVMLSLPLEIGGLAIFVARMSRNARAVSWTSGTARFGAVAAVFLLVNIAIFTYLIANYSEDFTATPRRLFLALDHSIFVGVLTMAIFGLIGSRGSGMPGRAGSILFFGITAGVAGFVAALLLDVTPGIHAATPVLGLAILHGVSMEMRALLRS